MKILIIRMMGLGDVASIGIPSYRLLQKKYPNDQIDFFSYEAGKEIMDLVEGINTVKGINKDSWPDEQKSAIKKFLDVAKDIAFDNYQIIYNLDTWFMPCLLARILMDFGMEVRGNFTKHGVKDLIKLQTTSTLPGTYFEDPSIFMDSTFINIADWTHMSKNHIWNEDYPTYYLNHCCDLKGEINMAIDVESDEKLLDIADGRKIVAFAPQARKSIRTFMKPKELIRALNEKEVFVWTGFDGSISIKKTLSKLKASDLLITVPSVAQWLARTVKTPVLLLPGPTIPSHLGENNYIPKFLDCQFCMQSKCDNHNQYACMDIDPQSIVKSALLSLL